MYDKLFLALMGASAAHAEASRAEFAEFGLTAGQPKILYVLRRGDGIVQKRLAELCGVRPATLTVLLGGLERRGYVCRKRCSAPHCRTAQSVVLTEEGRRVADLLEDAVEGLEACGFGGFSPQEREDLLEKLCRVTENLREYIKQREGTE